MVEGKWKREVVGKDNVAKVGWVESWRQLECSSVLILSDDIPFSQ